MTAFKILFLFSILYIKPISTAPILHEGSQEYCPSRTMNVYGHGTKAIIFVHGGRWSNAHSSASLVYKDSLVAMGYVFATIELTPNSAPAQLGNVYCAVDYLHSKGVRWVGLIGKSSGAHIVALAAVLHKVHAAVIISAPLDLTIGCKEHIAISYFGASCGTDALLKHSPIHRITSYPPPILIVHGTQDGVVAVKHAKVFYKKLVEVGGQSSTHLLLYNGGHEGLFVNEVIGFFRRVF